MADPAEGLGPVCHYIHLNPVRAGLCPAEELGAWPWTSLRLLLEPAARPKWYTPEAFLAHAGGLADAAAGRKRYLAYLGWLAEDEPARKALRFERMSKGWAIGAAPFRAELIKEQKDKLAAAARGDLDLAAWREQELEKRLTELLRRAGRTAKDLAKEKKSAEWKVALAAAMKRESNATNRWLGEHLNMGSLHDVSRRVSAYQRGATNAKTCPLSRVLGKARGRGPD